MTFFEKATEAFEENGYWIKNNAKFKRTFTLADVFYNWSDLSQPEPTLKWHSQYHRLYVTHHIVQIIIDYPELFKDAPETTTEDQLTCPFCNYEERDSWDLDNDDGGIWTCPNCDKESHYYPEKTITYRAIGRKPRG